MISKIAMVLLLASVGSLSACGGDTGTSSSSAPAGVVPAAPTAAVPVSKGNVTPLAVDVLTGAQWTSAACSLDTIDDNYSKDRISLDRAKPHVFRGWMLDEAKHPAGAFSVVLKGTNDYAISTATGELRKDVGEYFKDPALSTAGFSVSADLANVAAGDYDVEYVIQKAGKAYFCDTARTISLK